LFTRNKHIRRHDVHFYAYYVVYTFMDIYEELGVKRVINATYPLTRLGGSVLSKEVIDAMNEANNTWVTLWELEEKAGNMIANLTGAEAAHVTSGTFSALVLSAAACIAGKDPEKMRKLPDTTGMKNEIIIQRCLRSMYDRSMTVPGGKLVEVGDALWGCLPEQIEDVINEKTAAIHYLAYPIPGISVPIEEVIKIGKKHGVPIIVDASGQTYPPENLKKIVAMGADLVCYGGKYVLGPQSTGFVIGRRHLIEAIALHNFVGFESGPLNQPNYYQSIGRGFKLDRQEIVGLVVALKRWMDMDYHKSRIRNAWARANYLKDALQKIPAITITNEPEKGEAGLHMVGIRLTLEKKTGAETAKLVKELETSDPAIWVRYPWEPRAPRNSFSINTLFLGDGDEKIVATKLVEKLSV